VTRQYYYNLIYLRGLDILYIGPFYFYDPALYTDPTEMWAYKKADLLKVASEKIIGRKIKGHRIKVYLEIRPWHNNHSVPGYTVKRIPSVNALLNDQLRKSKARSIISKRSSELSYLQKFRIERSISIYKHNKSLSEYNRTYLGAVKISKRLDRVRILELLINAGTRQNHSDNWTYVSLHLELAELREKENYLAK
jgi:hypothetical protein